MTGGAFRNCEISSEEPRCKVKFFDLIDCGLCCARVWDLVRSMVAQVFSCTRLYFPVFPPSFIIVIELPDVVPSKVTVGMFQCRFCAEIVCIVFRIAC